MDLIESEMPVALLLERVVTPPDHEFVSNAGGRRSRGYVSSIELYNTQSRVHVVFTATPIATGDRPYRHCFQLRDSVGRTYRGTGGGQSDMLTTFWTAIFDPLDARAESVEIRYASVMGEPEESDYVSLMTVQVS